MALGFGRKKPADDTPATPETSADIESAPVAPHAPSSPPNVERDAFDLDTFDDLGTSPDALASTSGSAFDFPEDAGLETTTAAASEADAPDFDKLYEIERENAAQIAATNTAPAPFVPPTATIQEPAAPFYEPQVLVEAETEAQPKKKLPLVPILGAVAFLALAGGAASYFAGQSAPETDEDAPLSLPQRAARPGAPASVPAPVADPAQPEAPVKVIKLKPVPVAVDPLPAGATISPVSPGIAPVSARRSKLKALWKRGADAKHRLDYVSARRYWNQGLKIEPANVGFRESIAKLPK